MRIDKEYPATHSMDTAWYFVDEDDNVAIFEIDENGPVPHGYVGTQYCIQDLCFEYIADINDNRYNFTDEQVLAMTDGRWYKKVKKDYYWSNSTVFQININKRTEFLEYLSKIRKRIKKKDTWDFIPYCLSEKYGIYQVELNSYKYGKGMNNLHAKYLFENSIVLKHCDLEFSSYYDYETGETICIRGMESRCPYYLYINDWCAAPPHKRFSVPLVPMKLSQMPDSIRDSIIRLNTKFKDTDEIQIAESVLCRSTGWHKLYTPEGAVYTLVHLPKEGSKFVLDGSVTTEKCEELGLDDDDKVENFLQQFPRELDESRIEELLKLPINKDFVDLRNK